MTATLLIHFVNQALPGEDLYGNVFGDAYRCGGTYHVTHSAAPSIAAVEDMAWDMDRMRPELRMWRTTGEPVIEGVDT